MKHSNVVRRMELPAESAASAPAPRLVVAPEPRGPAPQRPRPRFERRAIVIRDQGFAPFRVR